MKTFVDRRVIEFERDEEALRLLEERQEAWLAGELSLARLLCRIDRKAAFLQVGASSIEDLAARRRYDSRRARDLRDLGYALEGLEGLEEALCNGEVSFVAALTIAPLYRFPERFLRENDDWLEAARTLRDRHLRRQVRQRIESVRQGGPATETWTAQVTGETRDDLARCHDVAVRKAGHGLTRGQLLAVLAKSFRLDFDPCATEGRPRRVPDTKERLHDRYVPAEVVRTVLARSGGWCEFGDCPRTATQLCHLRAHREGSGREAHDLAGGCVDHHKAYDDGTLRFLGWTDDGRPTFLVPATSEILLPRRVLPEDPESAWPDWMARVLGAKGKRRRRGHGGTAARKPQGDAEGDRQEGPPQRASDPRRPPPADGGLARDRSREAAWAGVGKRPCSTARPRGRPVRGDRCGTRGRIAPYRPRLTDPGHDMLR